MKCGHIRSSLEGTERKDLLNALTRKLELPKEKEKDGAQSIIEFRDRSGL